MGDLLYKRIAGIITYNPDRELLEKNVERIIAQVDYVLVVDNASEKKSDIDFLLHYDNLSIIFNKYNLGVSKALNIIMQFGLEHGMEWCLLLDQDSIFPADAVRKYDAYIKNHNVGTLAVLCPQVYDRNENNKVEKCNSIKKIQWCINSGAYYKIDIWNKIGRYDKNLFIDLIDYDYSIRLNQAGYDIVQITSIILNHSIGSVKVKRFGMKSVKIYNHSAKRKYYMACATVYLSRKHKDVKKRYKYIQNPLLKCVWRAVVVILYEKDKLKKCLAIYAGIIDGYRLAKRRIK